MFLSILLADTVNLGLVILDKSISEIFDDFCTVNGYCSGLASLINIAYNIKGIMIRRFRHQIQG